MHSAFSLRKKPVLPCKAEILPCEAKITIEMSICILVLKGIFGGSLKLTLQIKNTHKLCDRPRPTQGLPSPSGPEPRKSPKRVRKDFRLFSDSFETPGRTLWALLGPCPGVLFPDSFSNSSGVPGPKGPGDPVWGGVDRNTNSKNNLKRFSGSVAKKIGDRHKLSQSYFGVPQMGF